MYRLLFKQFLRTRTCQLGLLLLLVLGSISLIIGKQFLINKEKLAEQVIEKQEEHFSRNIKLHSDDLPLLLYYLKFALVNETDPMAGFSIGQKDLNPSVQRVTILTLEGQKYDTDLVNPTKLLYGNLDLSFVIIYVFPLLIIAFTYNLFSEEEESGSWKIVNVMARSKVAFLLAKLSVRFLMLALIMLLLFLVGTVVFGVEVNAKWLVFVATGLLYLIFWYTLCFWVVCLKHSSNFNALLLLSVWLILVILLPALINNYIITKYDVPEAFTTIIKQRDGYHQKWDTNKKETMEKFYEDYPQFAKYGYPSEEGFNWSWYYAMQHLGDVESREESRAMQQRLHLREDLSRGWAQVVPSMHAQLAFNDMAGTGLLNYMDFLSQTNEFHEQVRLYFYPLVFSNETVSDVDWENFKPEFYEHANQPVNWIKLLPLLISIVVFIGFTVLQVRKSH